MPCDVSVIIPAFNEEQRIRPTLVDLDQFLARSPYSYEIIVVDDGSTDGTVELATRLGQHIAALRCISTHPNRGKGHAVRIGMLAAAGEVRVMYDADGSIPAHELPKVIDRVLAGEADIAIGSRRAEGAATDQKQPFYRRWWSELANRVVQRVLLAGIRDTQCGFKAFSARAADSTFSLARIDGWAFDLEILGLACRMGLAIVEVGIHWSDDSRSRINPLRDAWKVFRELLIIRRDLMSGVYGDLEARRRRMLPPVSAAA